MLEARLSTDAREVVVVMCRSADDHHRPHLLAGGTVDRLADRSKTRSM